MTRRFVLATLVALVLAFGSGLVQPVRAQSTNAIAFCTFNSTSFTGPLTPTDSGWNWDLWCALNTNPGRILVVEAQTQNGQTLAQIGQTLASAVKAQAVPGGINITNVLLPSMSIVTPQ